MQSWSSGVGSLLGARLSLSMSGPVTSPVRRGSASQNIQFGALSGLARDPGFPQLGLSNSTGESQSMTARVTYTHDRALAKAGSAPRSGSTLMAGSQMGVR